MKRVKRKERKQRRTLKEDENDPFSIIPLDVIVEILLKVPTKSVASLALVSKQWLSIISGKYFISQYLQARSSSRLLFTVFSPFEEGQFLHSCSQVDPSSDHHTVNITPDKKHVHDFSPPIRGLICRQRESRVTIGNPTTGQFLTLPRLKTRRRGVLSFFGYDPVNDVYKVLCMTVLQGRQKRGSHSRVVSEEHQVYTLGEGQRKWRMVECKHPHLPPTPCVYTKGICINGVLYYYAWIQNKGALISFNLISEEFNVIKLPEDIHRLVNYTGKVAITSCLTANGEVHLWVLEDASKQEWSKVSIVVPIWRELVEKNHVFSFRGTVSTGELVFSPFYTNTDRPFFFIRYNLKENKVQKVVVSEFGGLCRYYKQLYFDHVESPMFCQM
ncbi:unnamed protein product [Eruca vesicaria subsp. sativa]|uniref:F-box domain-containing protein n=1 Tax=Eruca vesicaria subsp. sativa TaxID=29727 RepID=A0ABC8K4N2_ERUVS|nr:unnamed protein product [Eruca vesicaria subsp. sativa]